jgi:hypothetical protein
VHGFVQHQQIAGNDNQVRNAMNVAVVPAGTLTLNTDGMTPLTAPQNVQFADGDTIQFQLGGNQVGMTLTEGSDAARQAISGSLSQLSQHVIIDSNANNITNHMNAVIGFDPSTQANQLNVQNAVNALSGFGF